MGHRRRRGAAAGRAHPARAHAQRRRQAGSGNDVEHRGHARAQAGRLSTPGFAAADVVIERSFKTKPVHQGYIEPHACLVSVAKDGQRHHLEQQPGPLHGARHDGPADRHEAQRRARDPRRDRRRLRRQDHRLSGAAGAGPGAQVGAPGEDGDEPRRRCSAPRARPRAPPARSRSARPRTARSPPLQATYAPAGRRLPGLAHPRRRRLLALRPTTSPTCTSSATTS